MADCKLHLSGHFECNGFACKMSTKHISIEMAGDGVKVEYSAGVFSPAEIQQAIELITKVNKIVSKGGMEKF